MVIVGLFLGHSGHVNKRPENNDLYAEGGVSGEGVGSKSPDSFEEPNIDQTWSLPQPQLSFLRPMSESSEPDRQPVQPRCQRQYQLSFLSPTPKPMDRIIARAHRGLIVFGGFYLLSVAILAIPLVQRQ